jgi:hypothetical protein
MHSLAWDYAEEERVAFQAITKSTPGQVIDLPTPPDHIIIGVNLQAGTQWPKHLNLAQHSNFICIPIGLMSQCDKKAKVGTQEQLHIMPMPWIWHLPLQFGNVKVALLNTL